MKKFLPYILILVILVGLFSPMVNVNAEPFCTGSNTDPTPGCKNPSGTARPNGSCPIGLVPNRGPDDADLNNDCITPAQSVTADKAREKAKKDVKILTPASPPVNTKTTYTPLAPLPGLGDEDCKVNGQPVIGTDGKPVPCIDTTTPCAFGKYLNIMIGIAIGFAAVLAMVMIVMGGIQYMTSELPGVKNAGKERITNAILGLLIALGAYLLLNTINPELLKVCLDKLPAATIEIIKYFKISGAQTGTGAPINVNFKDACPTAKAASGAVQAGADMTPLILAIFGQESGGGGNVGGCTSGTANMDTNPDPKKDQRATLQNILNALGRGGEINTIRMSCGGSGSEHGGAIGLTQFIPTTWDQHRVEGRRILGHEPNPWNTKDALTMAALKLKRDGGASNPYAAACTYFGSCNRNVKCGDGTSGTYGNCVLRKMEGIKAQIAKDGC